MERVIKQYIFDPELISRKMIFLSGPRQIGKTTFAQQWLQSEGFEENYFNWDDPSVMVGYKRNPFFFKNFVDERFVSNPLPLVFDEIHKHKEWRNILKGFFDTNRERIKLLVTGSARLGFVRKSGDSLLGRYFSFQMFPAGLPEVINNFSHILNNEIPFSNGDLLSSRAREAGAKIAEEGLEILLKFSGFPEPLLRGSDRFHRRWQSDYKTLLTKEDVRDLTRISDIKGLESLVEILPTKVGSRLSIPSISQDLGRNYDTITNWLDILEGLYLIFKLRPWHKKIARAIRKEKKIYFFDWSLLSDPGRRFENLIAVTLLRMVSRFNEMGLGSFELRYIRDREKREVDFVLTKDNDPIALFEAKEGGSTLDKSGRYFSERLNIPLYQIVHKSSKMEEFPGACFIIPATNFLMVAG